MLVIWLSRNFLRSTFGRNTIAIGQDPVAAEMIGIRLLPNRMLSLAISAAFAGLAGGLLAHYLTFIQPSIFSMDLSGLLTAGVVAGGMGSITGPIVAIALFVGIPELFRGLALWRLVLYGVVLVVIINYRPKGLFGYEELSVANFPKLLIIIGVSIALAVGVGIYNYYADYWGNRPGRADRRRCRRSGGRAQRRSGMGVDTLGCAAFRAQRQACNGAAARRSQKGKAARRLTRQFLLNPSAPRRLCTSARLPLCSRSPDSAKPSAAWWRLTVSNSPCSQARPSA